MQDIVIVSAARTAVGKFGGSLAKLSATELGGLIIKDVVARCHTREGDLYDKEYDTKEMIVIRHHGSGCFGGTKRLRAIHASS